MTTATSSPAAQWDRLLRKYGGHLLQSWAWGDLKHRHGWVPERGLVQDGNGVAMAQVLFRHKGPVSIGYVPRGPLLDGDAEALWPGLMKVIDEMARRHRAISVIFEPDRPLPLSGTLFDYGLVKGPEHFQPVRTVKVPLLDDEALLKQMHQKTRYSVRLAARRGVEFHTLPHSQEHIARFYELMQDTSQRNEFGVHALDYYADFLELFGDDAVLMGAWSDEGNLAAMLIAGMFGNEAIYMYGGSSTKHRAHGAAFALQYEAMKWARERGAKTYDLWGIPAENPDSLADSDRDRIAGTKGGDWRGLYRFKVGFGGEIVAYPPTMERRYLMLLPALARRFRALGQG
ncbi:MAG TPA: peptidoglycan bridge formation glycyltransferase FemA/FemB family protein [Thermomicrobiales bacterium]|nr:peptidoglycan bridge formation glycyltransferase FemA/FemB family protein [Thermomicrobiales bacterium]